MKKYKKLSAKDYDSPVKNVRPIEAKVIGNNAGSVIFVNYPKPDNTNNFGWTPDKTQTFPLKDYEGGSHPRLRSARKRTVYHGGDEFYTKTDLTSKFNALILELTALKQRANEDYLKETQGRRDSKHHLATNIVMHHSIRMLKVFCSIPQEPEVLNSYLAQLNSAIKCNSDETRLYNPLDMQLCYPDLDYTNYSIIKAQGADLRTLITNDSVQAASFNKNLLKSYNKYFKFTPCDQINHIEDKKRIYSSANNTTPLNSKPKPLSEFIEVDSSSSSEISSNSQGDRKSATTPFGLFSPITPFSLVSPIKKTNIKKTKLPFVDDQVQTTPKNL